MSGHAQPFPLFEVVKFEDHAVNFVGITLAFARPTLGRLIQKRGCRGRGLGYVEFPRSRNDAQRIFHPRQEVRIVFH